MRVHTRHIGMKVSMWNHLLLPPFCGRWGWNSDLQVYKAGPLLTELSTGAARTKQMEEGRTIRSANFKVDTSYTDRATWTNYPVSPKTKQNPFAVPILLTNLAADPGSLPFNRLYKTRQETLTRICGCWTALPPLAPTKTTFLPFRKRRGDRYFWRGPQRKQLSGQATARTRVGFWPFPTNRRQRTTHQHCPHGVPGLQSFRDGKTIKLQ